MAGGVGYAESEVSALDTIPIIEGLEEELKFESVSYVLREKGLIIAGQLLERFTYVGIYALLPVYLMRYPMLLGMDGTIMVIHMFFFATFFLAFVAEMFVAAGMTAVVPSVSMSALVLAGTLGVFSVSLVAVLLASQRIFMSQASLLFHISAYWSLLLVAAGSGGLRSTLPMLGSWHYGATDTKRTTAAAAASASLAKHRDRLLLLLWYAEYTAYALAVIVVPLVAMEVQCFEMPNCYPAAYGLASATALGCLCAVAWAVARRSTYCMRRPKREGGSVDSAGIGPYGDTACGSSAVVRNSSAATANHSQPDATSAPSGDSSQLADGAGVCSARHSSSRAGESPWHAVGRAVVRVHRAKMAFWRYVWGRPVAVPECERASFEAACACGVRALATFGPMALFWGLYSQQNSTWVFQASRMQCVLRLPFWVRVRVPWTDGLAIRIRPEQTIVARPLCAMAMYPIVFGLVLPLVRKMRGGRPLAPTVTMVAGQFLAAAAFGVSAVLQAIVAGRVRAPTIVTGVLPWGVGTVPVILQLPQYVLMAAAELLFAPAAMAHVLHGDAPPSPDTRDSRAGLAVAFMHASGAQCAAQVLVGLVVAAGAGVAPTALPESIMWTLVVWTAIGAASALTFSLVLLFLQRSKA